MLNRNERIEPGYYRDPDWSVKDFLAHIGAWMAEARRNLLDIGAHSYIPHEVDVEARNAETLLAARSRTWEEVWTEANTARAWMLEAWFSFGKPEEAATQWLRKAGAEHYGEHLGRLRDWVTELVYLRTHQPKDDWDT
jgi:hypothetical protein